MKLQREYSFYKASREEFLHDHPGEFVVIRGDTVLGFYATENAALASMANEPLGTFLVKQCLPASDDLVEFRSRVIVA